MSLAQLRTQIAEVIDGPAPESGSGLSTGVPGLDERLAWGGVPRGRMTEIVGPRGAGKTTVIRLLMEATLRAGLGIAYIDATRTLGAISMVSLVRRGAASGGAVHFIRPPDPARAAWCADILLRSGAFAMVVLDGAPVLNRVTAVRLSGLARDTNAAFVVLADERGAEVGGAVRMRVGSRPQATGRRPPARWSRRAGLSMRHRENSESRVSSPSHLHSPLSHHAPIRLQIEKGGIHSTIEVPRAIDMARRLCTHPEVPDRRGVAPVRRHGIAAAAAGDARGTGHAPDAGRAAAVGRVGTRSRRCAEAGDWGLGSGDWGLGTGDWGKGNGNRPPTRKGVIATR